MQHRCATRCHLRGKVVVFAFLVDDLPYHHPCLHMHATKIFLLKGKKPLVGLNVYLSNNEHDQASSVAMRASHGYMGKLSINNKDCNEFCLYV